MTNFIELCHEILHLDSAIRFAGIASAEGKILATKYRQGLTPLLTAQETELVMIQSLLRMSILDTVKDKLGRTLYSSAVHEKVKSATIPFYGNEKVEQVDGDSTLYIVLRIEKDADHELIITSRILPFLKTKEEKLGRT